jgi:hypothetical protein
MLEEPPNHAITSEAASSSAARGALTTVDLRLRRIARQLAGGTRGAPSAAPGCRPPAESWHPAEIFVGTGASAPTASPDYPSRLPLPLLLSAEDHEFWRSNGYLIAIGRK